jgi:hypothetical protein
LKDFEICPSEPEISPEGHLFSASVKSFSGTNSEYPDESGGNFRIAGENRVALGAFTSLIESA